MLFEHLQQFSTSTYCNFDQNGNNCAALVYTTSTIVKLMTYSRGLFQSINLVYSCLSFTDLSLLYAKTCVALFLKRLDNQSIIHWFQQMLVTLPIKRFSMSVNLHIFLMKMVYFMPMFLTFLYSFVFDCVVGLRVLEDAVS